MRRALLGIGVGLGLLWPSGAAAARHATSVADLGPYGALVANEQLGTIVFRAVFDIPELDAANKETMGIAVARGRCGRPPGRRLTLARGRVPEDGVNLDVAVETGRTTLVLPHARSLRITADGAQPQCARLIGLRRWHRGDASRPGIATIEIAHEGLSAKQNLNGLAITREAHDEMRCTVALSSRDPATELPDGRRTTATEAVFGYDLLEVSWRARDGTNLITVEFMQGSQDVGVIAGQFLVAPDQRVAPRAREVIVPGDGEIAGSGRVKAYTRR